MCTIKIDDPLNQMDGCMGTYELELTNSENLNAVLYVRTTDDQEFKHMHCYKNIVPMALGAAVGGVCGVTIIGKCFSSSMSNLNFQTFSKHSFLFQRFKFPTYVLT